MRAPSPALALLVALALPLLSAAGCGPKERQPEIEPDTPLKIGDDSPLDQLGN